MVTYLEGFFSCSIHWGTSQPELCITLAILERQRTCMVKLALAMEVTHNVRRSPSQVDGVSLCEESDGMAWSARSPSSACFRAQVCMIFMIPSCSHTSKPPLTPPTERLTFVLIFNDLPQWTSTPSLWLWLTNPVYIADSRRWEVVV